MAESDVTKKLLSLHDMGKTIEKEKGSNPLKIGYPILVHQNATSAQCFAAPLFIWEIELISNQNKWTFRASHDAPSKNHALSGLIEARGIAINLDSLYDRFTDGQSLETFSSDYHNAIQHFKDSNPGILPNDVPSTNRLNRIPYPNKASLVSERASTNQFQLLNSALLGKFEEGKLNIIRDLETHNDGIEDLSNGSIPTASLGANKIDPSQASIIQDIIAGNHVVLHGPPGTGKSQSITAVITAAVSSGHSVAVVCQKLAALEVIESNLKELGIQKGVAKITDATKDRRKIVDLTREIYEYWRDQRSEIQSNEDAYSCLSDAINKSKKANQAYLGTTTYTFRDAIARLHSIESLLTESGQIDLLRNPPITECLHQWSSAFNRSLEDARRLEIQFLEVKDALPLIDLINENTKTAQIRPDLNLIKELLESRKEEKRTELNAREKLKEVVKEERERLSKLVEEIGNLLNATKSILSSGSREVRASIISKHFDSLDSRGFSFLIEELENFLETLHNLDNDKYLLQRNPQFEQWTKSSFVTKALLKLFNKEAKTVLTDWRFLQKQLKHLKLHANDDFNSIGKEVRAFIPQLQALYTRYQRLSTTESDNVPGIELTALQSMSSWWIQVAETPESYESIDLVSDLQSTIKAASNSIYQIDENIRSIQWLTTEGHEALMLHPEGGVFDRLDQYSIKLAQLKNWMESCNSMGLKPHNFAGLCSEWIEYHTLKYIIQNWENLELLPQSHEAIRQIEAEVSKVQEGVRQGAKLAIHKHFGEGVRLIEQHNAVFSFKQEFAKTGKNRKSLRKIFHRHPLGMTKLFPIVLTTPEVICNLFEGRKEVFDILIFDEASQVELQDSATSLLKGRCVVVAGDEHQMPPSHYFKSSFENLFEEDEDEDDINHGADIEVESLLEFCQQQPRFKSRYLDFHYRSQHPLLIQFSNHAIYSRLEIRPTKDHYYPIQLIDVQGTWENQHNLAEIDQILSLLKNFNFLQAKAPKILIATLNVTQRTKMIRAIQTAKSSSDFRRSIEPLEDAGLTVKNLENLQGDECDILIISIGYGRTPTGKFSRSYGAINQKHGYRLLNVLITRARQKVILFNSIPEAIHSQYEQELVNENIGVWSRGLLHAYIQYGLAITKQDSNRISSVLGFLRTVCLNKSNETQESTRFNGESFEESIRKTLLTQFQESEIRRSDSTLGIKVDMVIEPKLCPGLKIAIECDGEKFHHGWQNQLADFHKENLLKAAGIPLVRVWSRNWWMDALNTRHQLFNEINAIIKEWSQPSEVIPFWLQNIPSENTTSIATKSDFEIEEVCEPISNSGRSQIVDIPTARTHLPEVPPNHVLAPCLVTVEAMNNSSSLQIKYLFLSDHDSGFKGHSRDEWKAIAQKSGKMATFGEESELYNAFKGTRVDDIVQFRTNIFRVAELEFDY